MFPLLSNLHVHDIVGEESLPRPRYGVKFSCTSVEYIDAVPPTCTVALRLKNALVQTICVCANVRDRLNEFSVLQHLHFDTGVFFETRLRPGDLPANLVTLWIGDVYLPPNVLPLGLRKLSLGGRQATLPASLPVNLETLVLRCNVQIPNRWLPAKLKTLVLGDRYNYPLIDAVLHCKELQELTFAGVHNEFTHSLHGIHYLLQLQKLVIGYSLSEDLLDFSLPASLTELWCGSRFNRPFNRSLPNLQILHVGTRWNQPLADLKTVMPRLRVLHTGPATASHDQSLDQVLPGVKVFLGCRPPPIASFWFF